jgi:hypothetical protein
VSLALGILCGLNLPENGWTWALSLHNTYFKGGLYMTNREVVKRNAKHDIKNFKKMIELLDDCKLVYASAYSDTYKVLNETVIELEIMLKNYE